MYIETSAINVKIAKNEHLYTGADIIWQVGLHISNQSAIFDELGVTMWLHIILHVFKCIHQWNTMFLYQMQSVSSIHNKPL